MSATPKTLKFAAFQISKTQKHNKSEPWKLKNLKTTTPKNPKHENSKTRQRKNNWKTQQLESSKVQQLQQLDNLKPRGRKMNTSTIQKLENTKLKIKNELWEFCFAWPQSGDKQHFEGNCSLASVHELSILSRPSLSSMPAPPLPLLLLLLLVYPFHILLSPSHSWTHSCCCSYSTAVCMHKNQ